MQIFGLSGIGAIDNKENKIVRFFIEAVIFLRYISVDKIQFRGDM